MTRRITLCLPYYRNAGMLKIQLERLRALPQGVKDQLAAIIVDDGSPDGDAQGFEIGLPLSIYKIGVDVRWNQDAARNIAALKAESDWLLLTDIDHIVPAETWETLLGRKLSKNVVYRFSRHTWLGPDKRGGDRTEPYKPHPNSWLMRRGNYWSIGGYDERFAGFYGTDADFRDRVVAAFGSSIMLDEILLRVGRETIPDASTTTYQRKAPEDGAGMRSVKNAREALGPGWRPLNLTFPYKKIYESC